MSTAFKCSEPKKHMDDGKNLATTSLISGLMALFFFSWILCPMSIFFSARGVAASIKSHSGKYLAINIVALVAGLAILVFVTIPRVTHFVYNLH